MSGDDRDTRRGSASGPEPSGDGGSGDFDSRLKAARAKLDASRGRKPETGEPETKWQAIGYAMRIGTELVAATLVGVGIGWLLDQWLGTAPFLAILFLFVGGAAGVYNVYRLVAGQDQAIGWKRPTRDDDKDGPG